MSTDSARAPHARTYYRGLDGLRALAVIAVVVYHLFGPVLPGGYLGVDIFFVISGFLITSLLLAERARDGAVNLIAFWRRRVLRLVPALAALVLVCSSAAWLIGGDAPVSLGRQVLGAATFSNNWLDIAAGSDYFSQGAPELFRNLWSLAVEEQFYVLWPLAVLAILLVRRPWWRVGVVGGLGVASAVWMGVLYLLSGDATRVYFGTDSHSFGLMIGAALALAVRQLAAGRDGPALWPAERPADPIEQRVAKVLPLAGLGALTLVLFSFVLLGDDLAFSYLGGMALVSVLMAVVIWAAVSPGSWLGGLLEARGLRWIGVRSYGLYLWHWPVLALTDESLGAWHTTRGGMLVAGLITLIVTVVAATVSYRFVEQPARRLGVRGSIRRLRERMSASARGRHLGIAAFATAAVLVAGTTVGMVTAPNASQAEQLVQRGEDAVAHHAADAHPPNDADESQVGTGGPDEAGAGDEADGDDGSGRQDGADGERPGSGDNGDTSDSAPPKENSGGGEAGVGEDGDDGAAEDGTGDEADGAGGADDNGDGAPDSSVPVPAGDTVTAVGDSVMLASAPALQEALPGITIDAQVSRFAADAPDILSSMAADGTLGHYVVVGLGTNGPIPPGVLDGIRSAIGPARQLVLVTAQAPRDWIEGVNHDLRIYAGTHPNTAIADWHGAIAPHLDDLAGDAVHPGPTGGHRYADVVAEALGRLAAQ